MRKAAIIDGDYLDCPFVFELPENKNYSIEEAYTEIRDCLIKESFIDDLRKAYYIPDSFSFCGLYFSISQTIILGFENSKDEEMQVRLSIKLANSVPNENAEEFTDDAPLIPKRLFQMRAKLQNSQKDIPEEIRKVLDENFMDLLSS